MKGLKNIFPYFMIIIIYFLLINLESLTNQKNNRKINHKDNDLINTMDHEKIKNKSITIDTKRISIPVIPFTND